MNEATDDEMTHWARAALQRFLRRVADAISWQEPEAAARLRERL